MVINKTYSDFLADKTQVLRASGHEPRTLSPILYDFQRDIVRWAVRLGRAAIFADCGLGKTLMQLEWTREACEATGRPALILAPPAVSHQTAKEALKLGFNVQVCRDQSDVQDGVNITNYERLHLFDASVFGAVVLDESSILKSYTGKTRNELIDQFADTPYKLACTATPAPNDHTELGNHSEFLGVMSRVEMLSMFFVHDGGSTQDWRVKGHARALFWEWVCSWAAVVRSPEDLGYDASGFDLPPLHIHTEEVMQGVAPPGHLFHGSAKLDLQERRQARRDSMSKRVERTSELVNGSDVPWVVWCELNAEADALVKAIPGSEQVSGSMSPDEKADTLSRFSDGELRVLITKPKIAGFGLNWQHADRMAFCGLSDSYEQFYQAVRRLWRFGQKSPVHAYIVISAAENVVSANIRAKEERAQEMAREVAGMTSAAVVRNIMGQEKTVNIYETEQAENNAWTVYLGDCVEVISGMDEGSIDYSVFSPPFASLYTYSASDRDMGNCRDHSEFFAHCGYLAAQLFRVLREGRLVSFHCMNLSTLKARDGVIGLTDFRGDLIRMFQDAGFIFHSEVVIWKNPVTAMQRTKALGLLHKQLRKDSCMSRQGIPDYVVTMRKPGVNTAPVQNTNESFPVSEWQEYASPVWMDINQSDTLQKTSAREEHDERHICPLQLEVIRRCLRLWSREGDLVLSPFAGIGSEGFEALKAGRRFVGVELKRSYWEQAVKNMRVAEVEAQQRSLFDAPAMIAVLGEMQD